MNSGNCCSGSRDDAAAPWHQDVGLTALHCPTHGSYPAPPRLRHASCGLCCLEKKIPPLLFLSFFLLVKDQLDF